MCRIAGIISTNTPNSELIEKVKLMCKSLAHGGPDDEGFYQSNSHGLVFGHRRLAIIDLSPKGHQPMADNDQKIWITFNGEIYNYLDLKKELSDLGVVFYTDTDTEVIIQAYKHWGVNSFSALRGIFAFALFDEHENLTYLVRDSQGIKPLFYYNDGPGISFASETRAFKDAGIAEQVDEDWPIRFLAFGHIPEPFTTLKNIFCLSKGHYLRWDHQTCKHSVLPYRLPFSKTTITDVDEAKKVINRALNNAVQRQLLADAPIGVFLSGGIDSSLLTLLADKHKKKQLKTVSIFFDEHSFNEKKYQDVVVNKTTSKNYSHLVTEQIFSEALPRIIHDMDMPTTDGINSWFISKYAHEDGLKAVLSGLGGDELFGGYPSFKRIKYLKYLKSIPSFLLNGVSKLSVGRARRLALLAYQHPLAEYLFLRGLFVPEDIANILQVSKRRVTSVLFANPINVEGLNDQERAGWFETNIYMQNQLLRDTDVMSMAHALEVRVPFLDEDFVHAVEQIDPSIRFNNQKPKQLLIDSNSGVLPKEIWDRTKMGFSFPLQKWMQGHKQISDPSFYKGSYTRKVITDFNTGKVHWSKVFALYQLSLLDRVKEKAAGKKIVLLTLQTFGSTGGIQKMTRTLAKVLGELADKNHWQFDFWSGYDAQESLDTNYIEKHNFNGFNKNRKLFAAKAIAEGIKSDVVILSHINLSLIGWLIKLLRPTCKVWLIAHGVEVWRPLSFFKKRLLSKCDKVICVSGFTRQKMIDLHNVNQAKLVVLNNALDPLIKLPDNFQKPGYLLDRHKLTAQHKVIFTLTRLASSEQYKGYEKVIEAVSILKATYPEIKYILAGKYDESEAVRIEKLIHKFCVRDNVILTGFIAEAELEDHFLLADVFVLPSKKEGFGIVFIEALACGLPVICGNEDGSGDAIKNGELGTAINVDSVPELTAAITKYFTYPPTAADKAILQAKCLQYFSASNYGSEIEKLLTDERN